MLESFEIVPADDAPAAQAEPSTHACIAAIALLTSLVELPAAAVVTATVPLAAPCYGACDRALLPLSAASVQCDAAGVFAHERRRGAPPPRAA